MSEISLTPMLSFQNSCVEVLPKTLQNWKFLPIWMRSLKYYDPFMSKIFTSLPWIGGFFRNGGAYKKRRENEQNGTDDLAKKVQKLVKLSGQTQV
uniref:Bestrophin homolog n=1 Tax=Caenorhabditis tropicalis TaxID=1561998 RepID=A0A1I7UAD2_9PELO